jgi:hypothetical protein
VSAKSPLIDLMSPLEAEILISVFAERGRASSISPLEDLMEISSKSFF